jgi:hypothetical protein
LHFAAKYSNYGYILILLFSPVLQNFQSATIELEGILCNPPAFQKAEIFGMFLQNEQEH